MLTLAPAAGRDWTDTELREVERLRSACLGVDQCRVELGKTDAGDPWAIVYDLKRHRAAVHVARIDRRYVTGFPIERRCLWSTTLGAAIDIALARITALPKKKIGFVIKS
jgi:hypothetical protein